MNVRRTWLLIGWMVLGLISPAYGVETIEWNFDHPREVAGVVKMEPGRLKDGRLAGETAWDPYVSLNVSPEGIDAAKFTWLTVRLYSSEKADLLDIYYESPDKRWCLGGKLPIVKGWATYRLDLTKNHWRETRTGDVSKQWGGPSKRVSSLRIDPGNQAGRWVALDYVKLQTAEPDLEEGVTVEPRGTAQLAAINAPGTVEAGNELSVSVELEVDVPPELTSGVAWIRLCRGGAILRLVEQPVAFSGRRLKFQAKWPISAYWYPGPARIECGCYELDVATGSAALRHELQITNDRVGAVRPPVVELRQLGGDPAIYVSGRPIPGYLFVSHGDLHLDYHREIAQAGIHLYGDWLGTSRFSDMGHVEPDRYDYAEFDHYFAAILDVDPQAYFIPHIGVAGPLWWQKAHPEEMCQFENGTKGPTSFASERWRREMGEDLRRLIAYLRKAPYADRILGYMFYSGYTAEWQMWGAWQASRCDYSEPALRAFRAFLTRRYATDERLRAAWGDPTVTLASAAMPDGAKRRPGGPQVLRDPKTERQAIDFYEFISNMDADALLHFARIVREATEGQSLVGTYYAYLTAHGINQQDSGHLAAKRVFDSPDIDFLMSPPNYWYRKPGEACTFMSATDSFRLRGKLWLDESDHRTHLTHPGAGYGRASTLDETLGVFWREVAEVLTKRAAVSWFDMRGGWFSDPQILAAMRRGHEIARDSLARRKPFSPQIGVFVDPQSFYWMRPTMANASLALHQVVTMPQSGAPWDFCLLDDIADPRLPDYKLYVFLNAFFIDPARREAIQAKLKRNGATALFYYAPGYFGPEGAAPEQMRALTGITIVKDDREGKPQLLVDAADPLAQGLPADKPLGAQRVTVSPIFYADDPEARIAGRMVDGKQPGLVVKRMDGWTSVYSGAMQLPQALMRNIARAAGVHVWIETDDALYTDGQYLGLHAATDGPKTLTLPGRFEVVDAISGKPVPSDGQTVTLPMKKAQTVLLRLVPAR
jgi:hypothetical protein